MNKVKNALSSLDTDTMNKLAAQHEQGRVITIAGYTLSRDMLEVKLDPKPEYAVAMLGNNLVVLDIELNPQLVEEGNLRELIREIQVARKDAGLELSDRIDIEIETENKTLSALVDKYKDDIMTEVLALHYGTGKALYTCKISVGNMSGTLKISKAK